MTSRVLEGGEGWINGGRSEKSRDKFALLRLEDDMEASLEARERGGVFEEACLSWAAMALSEKAGVDVLSVFAGS